MKLNTNENPYPPSEKAVRAIGGVPPAALRLYPDPDSTQVKEAVGRFWDVPADHVFVGNGSDEVLAFVFQGLLHQDSPLVFPDITYSFYPTYCGLFDIPYTLLPLESDLSIDLETVPASAKAVIFPNPNAPTGRALARDTIEAFVKAHPDRLVVVDEAYVDFGAESCAPLTRLYPNLLVTQSLSKSRALAGLRVGFAIGQPDLLAALQQIKDSFNSYPIERLVAAGAVAAMDDRDWFESNRKKVIASRETLTKGLIEQGFTVVPSQANFVFAKHPSFAGAGLAASLREKKILVRHFAKPRIDQYLRITVGSDAQVATLLATLKTITT